MEKTLVQCLLDEKVPLWPEHAMTLLELPSWIYATPSRQICAKNTEATSGTTRKVAYWGIDTAGVIKPMRSYDFSAQNNDHEIAYIIGISTDNPGQFSVATRPYHGTAYMLTNRIDDSHNQLAKAHIPPFSISDDRQAQCKAIFEACESRRLFR